MDIYLIRHTTPTAEKGTCFGQADIDANPSFLADAEAVRAKLPRAFERVAVYSSPLQRCRKLAQHLDCGKPRIDARLMEMSFGDWEMKPWHAISKRALDDWGEDFVNRAPPNGESFRMLYERSAAFYEELRGSAQHSVAVVSHAGVIRSILVHVLGMPLQRAFALEVDFGSVSKICTEQSITKVLYLNR